MGNLTLDNFNWKLGIGNHLHYYECDGALQNDELLEKLRYPPCKVKLSDWLNSRANFKDEWFDWRRYYLKWQVKFALFRDKKGWTT